MTGRFISIEGPDGSGKSTQARMLADHLRERGFEILLTREPGGSPLSDRIRELVLGERCCPVTELMLMLAARSDHLAATVRPALADGIWVVCDRFVDSTTAYQVYGRGLPEGIVVSMNRFACGGFQPDLTLVLDLPAAAAAERLVQRSTGNNRFDRESAAFAQRVRIGYEIAASRNPHRCVLVDASGSPEQVRERVVEVVRRRLVEYNKL